MTTADAFQLPPRLREVRAWWLGQARWHIGLARQHAGERARQLRVASECRQYARNVVVHFHATGQVPL